jgi:peroxiredoxin
MSKPIDQRNRGNTPGPTRRPAAPTARPPASSGKGQANNGTPRATGPKAGTRPAPRSAVTTTSRKPQARKSSGLGGWKPLDLAIIFGFMVVVGLVIWFGLGNVSGNSAQSNLAGAGTNNGQTTASTNSGEPPLLVNIGQTAPDFSLPGTDGQTYSLSQFKGKVVLLEFMAPWCPHCQDDAPVFNQVHEAYKDKNLQMLAVNATGYGRNYDNGDESPITMDDQVWFHDNFHVAYPLLFDKDVKLAQQYGISHFPTVFILDTNGTVVATPPNPITFDGLKGALDLALGGTASADSGGR